jgi:hypothetical protein
MSMMCSPWTRPAGGTLLRWHGRAHGLRSDGTRGVVRHATARRQGARVRKTVRRATWAGMLLEAGQELQASLPLDEAAYEWVAGPSHADARAYFAYSATQLVLATSAAILRWLELLEKMEEEGQESVSF